MTPLQKTVKFCAIIFALVLAVSIIGGIAQVGISFFSLFSAEEKEISDELYTVELPDENFSCLEIDFVNADLSITVGDSFTLKSDSKNLNTEIKKDTLFIEGVSPATSKVIITVPAKTVFSKADISLGMGNVKAENFEAENFNFELGLGSATFTSVTFSQKSEIEIGVGKGEFVSSFLSNTETDIGIGKFSYHGVLSGKGNFDLGITTSDFEYMLIDEGGFFYECGIGFVTIDGKNFGKTVKAYSEDRPIYTKIENGIGTINIHGYSLSE